MKATDFNIVMGKKDGVPTVTINHGGTELTLNQLIDSYCEAVTLTMDQAKIVNGMNRTVINLRLDLKKCNKRVNELKEQSGIQ